MTGLWILGFALLMTACVSWGLRRTNGVFRDRATDDGRLDAAAIGGELGERATLVQFSSAFCSPCRATRALLTDIADSTPGVVTYEIDAESHLELVRQLDVMRTPTVFVLDSKGTIVGRASGLPKRDQVMAALAAVPSR